MSKYCWLLGLTLLAGCSPIAAQPRDWKPIAVVDCAAVTLDQEQPAPEPQPLPEETTVETSEKAPQSPPKATPKVSTNVTTTQQNCTVRAVRDRWGRVTYYYYCQ